MRQKQTDKILSGLLGLISITVINGADFKADRTLYVSAKGSDSNNGLSDKTAFQTIGKAAEIVQPGDTVIVKGGKYQEHLIINKAGTEGKPITFRAAPNETVIVTWGWDIDNWKKVEGTRFCYESSFPYAINMLWDKKCLGMYLEVGAIDLLDKQPGGFIHDKKTGKIFVHTFDCGNPEYSGIVAVPYSDGKKPIPSGSDISKAYRWGKGFAVKSGGSYNIIDGFELAFHPTGIQIRDEAKKCVARNNTVYGTTTGISSYNSAGEHLLENNKAYWNSGPGIIVEGNSKDIIVRNNYLFNNGHCPPFTGADAGSGGHPFNLASYGGGINIDFLDNIVISDDPSRCVGVMRCKYGISGNMIISGNLLIGGSTDFYPAPDQNHIIKNNTVVGGKIRYTEKNSDGKEYKPELVNNLSLLDNKSNPCFADPSFYDYRLRKDSPFLGSGAYPEAAQVVYVDASGKTEGDGSSPEKSVRSLSAALKKTANGGTIYILPGTYKEIISLSKIGGDKNISVRNYGKGKVVFEDSQFLFKDCKNLTFDGIIFKKSKAQLQNSDSMEFLRCVFDEGENAISAENCKLVKIINDTFIGNSVNAANSALVLRNNLFIDCKALPVKAEPAKTITENNAFSGINAEKILAEWKSKFNENIPSFVTVAKLNSDYQLPDESKLVFSGLGCTFVGACGTEKKSKPVTVENLKPAIILSDRVVLAWETPFDYPDVKITCKDKSGKIISTVPVNQGMYKQTVNSECISGLNPDSQYNITLVFTNPGGTGKTEKTLTVTTTEKKVFQPKTIYVSKGGEDSKSGLSANNAKKSLHGALCAAMPGDTILVAPGVYTEQNKIFIDGISKEKPLTIKSEKPGQAEISANYIFNNGLTIYNGKYIIIDGFKFSGLRYSATVTALDISKSDGIVVKNCIFDRDRRKSKEGGCSNVQLKCEGVKDIEVSNCIFDNGFHGIWMSDNNNNVRIFNNTFWHIGINAIHVGCSKDANIDIYNNIFMDVVGNHTSPAVSLGTHGEKAVCDYNIYWKTGAVCPGQKVYGIGGGNGYSAPWSVLKKDMAETIEDARKMYGVEKNGQFADPLLKDPQNNDFSLKPGSPALGKGKNNSRIGADMSIFSK